MWNQGKGNTEFILFFSLFFFNIFTQDIIGLTSLPKGEAANHPVNTPCEKAANLIISSTYTITKTYPPGQLGLLTPLRRSLSRVGVGVSIYSISRQWEQKAKALIIESLKRKIIIVAKIPSQKQKWRFNDYNNRLLNSNIPCRRCPSIQTNNHKLIDKLKTYISVIKMYNI